MKFKQKYEERYKRILGDEYEIFKEYIVKPLPASIRINTLKIEREKLFKRFERYRWKLKQVPFYENGFVFETKKPVVLGNTLEHFLGYFYMQEVASMIPPVVLDPKPGEFILDMAAAPGSKTTQMAQMMNNRGIIVANEKDKFRIIMLRANLQRCGVMNAVVTNMDGRKFKEVNVKFDKILLDAPCTGSGAIMKSLYTLKMWNIVGIIKMAKLQKKLITAAHSCLKECGTLVYSTCSLEPEENEFIINYAIEELGMKLEKIKLKGFKTRPGLTEFEGKKLSSELEKTIRIYPQDNNTEGFFVAKLRK